MTKEEAKSFKNFSFKEKTLHGTLVFERYDIISYPFMLVVDNMVSYAKDIFGKKRARFFVYDINLLKHKPDSFHYAVNGHLSIAIDGAFEGLSPMEAFAVISKFRFTGVGYYPDWEPMPGWHIDKRPWLVVAYWLAHKVEGKQVYDNNFLHFIEAIKGNDRT